MKKIILSLCFMIAAVTFVTAQDNRPPGGGQGQGGGGARMREQIKQRLKDDVKLTDVQADSVLSIQQEFQMKNRDVMRNADLKDDDKKAKTKELMDARTAKLKGIVSDDQIKKIDEMYDNMRKARQQQGQGGNTPPPQPQK